ALCQSSNRGSEWRFGRPSLAGFAGAVDLVSAAVRAIESHAPCPLYPRKRTWVGRASMSAFDPIQTFDDELGGAESLPGYSRTVGLDRSGGETRAAFASNQHGIVWQYQSGVGGPALPRDGRWRRSHDAR